MTGTETNMPAGPAISPAAMTPKITRAGWSSIPRAMTDGLVT